jgi:hypothetical protein
MPWTWPVLRGSRCALRVLAEEDAPLWRIAEDDRQFLPDLEFYAKPVPVSAEGKIRGRRMAWALGGGVRHWGMWTVPGDQLAGGIQLSAGGLGGPVRSTVVTWVVWKEFADPALVAEAVALAARWGLENLDPDHVLAFLPDTGRDPFDERVVEAAGFRPDGSPEPWEAGRLRYRFST